MEKCRNEKKTIEEVPLLKNTRKKGGIKAAVFIIGNDALEKMATFGLMANMIMYLTEQYHMEMATASNILFFWSAATNLTPLVGAVIADSYLGRFYSMGFGSVMYLMGMIILWLTTLIPQARPPSCNQFSGSCNPPAFLQSFVLCASLGLISIGAGGIRSSSLAFGANQLENEDCQENGGVGERYFMCYYAAYTLSVFIGLTCLVYIQDNKGWTVGFAVPVVLMMLGNFLFFLGSPFYVQVQNKTNILTGFVQVMVACYRNRHFKLPSDTGDLMYHKKNGSSYPALPSEKLRFLNKACIVKDPEKDLMPDGRAQDPWSLCTGEQVEDFKAFLRIVPIWSSGVLLSASLSQSSFPVLQAASMDRRITSGLTIPAASLSIFSVISCVLWIMLYDRVFLPLASRLMARSVHLSSRRRMGIGIFLSSLAMMVTALVESIRLRRAKGNGSDAQHMSALWLVPQYCLSGFAESSNDIAQIEFYFSELPRSMSAIASNIDGLGVAVGNLLASFVMNIVDNISKAGGKTWISSNINDGHYDYYYLVLTGLSVANMVYYIVCAKAYGPLQAEKTAQAENEDEL